MALKKLTMAAGFVLIYLSIITIVSGKSSSWLVRVDRAEKHEYSNKISCMARRESLGI